MSAPTKPLSLPRNTSLSNFELSSSHEILRIKEWKGRIIQKDPSQKLSLSKLPLPCAPSLNDASDSTSATGEKSTQSSTASSESSSQSSSCEGRQTAHLEVDASVQRIAVERRLFTNEEAEDLVQMYPSLTEIILINCTIGDTVFSTLAQLNELKSLTLGSCKISDKGFTHFLLLSQLVRLVISGPTFDDNNLRFLIALPQLRQLEFSKCNNITASKLELICQFVPTLEVLIFHSMHISDLVLEAIIKLQKLHTLTLNSCSGFTDHGLTPLASMRELVKFSLIKCVQVTDAALKNFAKFSAPKLEVLNLSGCVLITHVGLVHCIVFPKLRTLILSHCKALGDKAMVEVAKIKGLRHLDISFCNGITDAGLSFLSSATQLETLQSNDCHQITKLTPLAKLIRLRYLIMRNCEKIKNEELLHIVPCVNITSLDLSFCPEITAAGLKPVAKALQRIQKLFLNDCPNLTQEGMDVFDEFPQLKFLSLHKCFERQQDKREFLLEMREKHADCQVSL